MLVENIAKALTKLEEPNHCKEAQLPTAKNIRNTSTPTNIRPFIFGVGFSGNFLTFGLLVNVCPKFEQGAGYFNTAQIF